MADLTALIERLEKADGPDRELDALIWCVEHPQVKFISCHRAYGADDKTQVSFTIPPKRTEMVTGGTSGFSHAPNVTGSIDAAVALAERVVAMEGRKLICFFCAGGQLTPHNADETSPDYHPKAKIDNSVTAGWMAHVAFYNSDGAAGYDEYSHGRTAPLAICLATLRALSAQEGSK